MEILRGMEVKITGVIHRLIFFKKKIYIYFFFFGGGGGHICASYWGGGARPPCPPYSYGPVRSYTYFTKIIIIMKSF